VQTVRCPSCAPSSYIKEHRSLEVREACLNRSPSVVMHSEYRKSWGVGFRAWCVDVKTRDLRLGSRTRATWSRCMELFGLDDGNSSNKIMILKKFYFLGRKKGKKMRIRLMEIDVTFRAPPQRERLSSQTLRKKVVQDSKRLLALEFICGVVYDSKLDRSIGRLSTTLTPTLRISSSCSDLESVLEHELLLVVDYVQM
jgi:hypothetical protein